MIWRLFKPRPIVKVCIPGILSAEEHKLILKDLDKRMGKEYVVMLVMSSELNEVKIEIVK
jgi:hypothetical protein